MLRSALWKSHGNSTLRLYVSDRSTVRDNFNMVIGATCSSTAYKIKAPMEQYVRCRADILLNGVRRDLEGESRCIVRGNSTRIKVQGGRIAQVEPPEAILQVVEVRAEHGTVEIV